MSNHINDQTRFDLKVVEQLARGEAPESLGLTTEDAIQKLANVLKAVCEHVDLKQHGGGL